MKMRLGILLLLVVAAAERHVPALDNNVSHSKAPPISRGWLRKEAWALPLLCISGLCLLCMTSFEVWLLCEWRRRPLASSRRHLFLGQALLVGLVASTALAGVMSLVPTPTTCGAVRLGAGLSLALVFSALLVKCVFLLSLNGGVYLPAPYQASLLLFAVLVQVAIGIQWLLHHPPALSFEMTQPPARTPTEEAMILCSAPYPHLLFSLCYVACLAVAVAAASSRCRRVRENRRESLYICLASLLSLPLSLAWALAGLALPPRHKDAALAAGLLATSAAVFAIMFLPKGRRMAAVGRAAAAVPRYGLTDDEDDISRSPSAIYGARYSPSFFHFKPGEGGDGTSPSHVYKLPPSLIPSVFGDRVALVAGPLPSPLNLHSHPTQPIPMYYPRLYHCYPIYQHHLHQTKSNHLTRNHQQSPKTGLYMKPEEGNVYTTLEPTLSSNPNVFFHRGGLNTGMMY